MNGCAPGAGYCGAVCVREARDAVRQLRAAVDALRTGAPSGIIRIEVPISLRVDAIEWLQAQSALPRCFFSARALLPETPALAVGSSNGNGGLSEDCQKPVSIAGVGSAVFSAEPSLSPWQIGVQSRGNFISVMNDDEVRHLASVQWQYSFCYYVLGQH
jgi:menaquinone-specific isochorismate synthase